MNLSALDDESLLGARLRADCVQVGVQAAEEGFRPVATRASASDSRSGLCLDLTPTRLSAVAASRPASTDRLKASPRCEAGVALRLRRRSPPAAYPTESRDLIP